MNIANNFNEEGNNEINIFECLRYESSVLSVPYTNSFPYWNLSKFPNLNHVTSSSLFLVLSNLFRLRDTTCLYSNHILFLHFSE